MENAKTVLRKHLIKVFKGKAWDALLESLAFAVDKVWEMDRAAFDQAFLVSASGKYLKQRAAEEGITGPVGLSDEIFRELAILLYNKKLTPETLWEMLEIFYGPDAVRISVTSATGPFALQAGQDLWLMLDDQLYVIQFQGESTTDEVVNKINTILQGKGFAVNYQNSVRIYSGRYGVAGRALVVGGTAMVSLGFPGFVAPPNP